MSLPWICRTCRSTPNTSLQQFRRVSYRSNIISNSSFFQVSEEVRQAVSENRPVVALETTIYTHGFPYPQNMALATNLENLVRQNGGIPATIGILDGVARVGFNPEDLERLVSLPGSPSLIKVSRRDIAFALGLKGADEKPLHGGTTISGTMVLAHLAGIKVFATGGLGGVHRGAENSMDISADLTELGRTPVAVISSGCKSFLDIARTLEYLETQGVAVATFADGRAGKVDFPGFYTRESGVRSPVALRDELEAARVIFAQNALGLRSGMHFANPIPEKYSLPFEQMEKAIAQAIQAAEAAGATGNASTPYILDKIKEITGSRSVEANTALVESNVIRGTKVAVELRKLEMEGEAKPEIEPSSVIVGPAASNYTAQGVPVSYAAGAGLSDPLPPTVKHLGTSDGSSSILKPSKPLDIPAEIYVAGSLAVDLSCDFAPISSSSTSPKSPSVQTSNPARITQSLGGVGHNVARAAHLMGAQVRLCSAVGSDLAGSAALEALVSSGMSTTGIATFPAESGSRTAQYVAINDTAKDLVMAMADMAIISSSPSLPSTFENLWLPQLQTEKPKYLVVDGNWPPQYLSQWLQAGKDVNASIMFEPVSTAKATSLFNLPPGPKGEAQLGAFPHASVRLSTPNSFELSAMYTAARERNFFERGDWWGVIDALGIPSTGARVQMAMATSSKLVDEGIPQMAVQLLPFIPTLLTKLGADGVLLTQLLPVGDERLESAEAAPHILSRCGNETEGTLGVGGVYMRLFPAAEKVEDEDVVSVNGVGDTFAGTLIAGLSKGRRVEEVISVAQRAAVLSLRSQEAVSGKLDGLRGEL